MAALYDNIYSAEYRKLWDSFDPYPLFERLYQSPRKFLGNRGNNMTSSEVARELLEASKIRNQNRRIQAAKKLVPVREECSTEGGFLGKLFGGQESVRFEVFLFDEDTTFSYNAEEDRAVKNLLREAKLLLPKACPLERKRNLSLRNRDLTGYADSIEWLFTRSALPRLRKASSFVVPMPFCTYVQKGFYRGTVRSHLDEFSVISDVLQGSVLVRSTFGNIDHEIHPWVMIYLAMFSRPI